MVTLPTLRYTRLQKNKWLACASLHSLQVLLKLSARKLHQAEKTPAYTIFTIPKKNGDGRTIENPNDHLKEVQRGINNYLQAVYYFFKHPSSYGFCMTVRKEKFPHNIYTHALQHTGCNYLINADLKDFFHTVSWQRLYDIFEKSPFIHDEESIKWLCNITTHQGRLPMGAPTSPVLSNLAAGGMDTAMEMLAKRHECKYTRYADDLSFSSVNPLHQALKDEILSVITEQGFVPNMKKIKLFDKNDIKIITGLQVAEKVTLGKAYWQKTDMLVQQLTSLKCLLQTRPSISVHHQAEDIMEKINGFLAFASMIGESEEDNIYRIQEKLDNAEQEMEDFESLAWDDIPYMF
jgi:RNA-directed DNA polymerase